MALGRGESGRHTEQLVARAKHGDPDARRDLVEQHVVLVRSLARRYRDLGLPVEDLAQEGAIGLLEAIDRFDPNGGASFSTYAFWRARQSITHALTDRGRLLRLPKHLLERRRAIVQATAVLRNAGQAPTAGALAHATNLSLAEVDEALAAPTTVGSLDVLEHGRSFGAELVDSTAAAPEEVVLARFDAAALDGAVLRLPDRERKVIEGHFGFVGEPKSLAGLGAVLHVSPSRVREIEREALLHLAVELEGQLVGP